MSPEQLIAQTRENASEWLEMSDNPDQLMIGILANKVVELNDKIVYLEGRLDHVSRHKTAINS